MVTEPSWENVGFLAWDVVSLVPGIPGSYLTKGTSKALKGFVKKVRVTRKVKMIGRTSETAAKGIKKLPKAMRVKVLVKNKKYLNKMKN